MKRALSLVLLAACGGTHAASTVTDPSNLGGDAPFSVDAATLKGPYARIEDAPHLMLGTESQVTTLARADGAIGVAFVEERETDAAASCFVVLETGAGVYIAEDFLCAALRSDETVSTDDIHISIEGDTATIRFRISYQLEQETPDVHTYEVTCILDGKLSCTPPPAVGGYASQFSSGG